MPAPCLSAAATPVTHASAGWPRHSGTQQHLGLVLSPHGVLVPVHLWLLVITGPAVKWGFRLNKWSPRSFILSEYISLCLCKVTGCPRPTELGNGRGKERRDASVAAAAPAPTWRFISQPRTDLRRRQPCALLSCQWQCALYHTVPPA